MAAQQPDQRTEATEGTAGTVKRRGLIAAAAALVAGIIAKQTSQPVAAATIIESRFIASGTTGDGFYTTGDFDFGVRGFGHKVGVLGSGNTRPVYGAIEGIGVQGIGAGNDAGVVGTGSGSGYGVLGQGGGGTNAIGVRGTGQGTGAGAEGQSGGPNANGVQGYATAGGTGAGVLGVGTVGVYADGVNNGVYGKASVVGGSGVAGAGTYGLYGTGTATGVYGQASDMTGGKGVWGHHARGNVGVYGDSNTGYGVLGSAPGGIGISGQSTNGLGARFSGGVAPLLLDPQAAGSGPPASGTHAIGEQYVDSEGSLFFSVAAGTPGTWRKLAGPNPQPAHIALGPFFLLPVPDRFVDTRTGLGGVTGPLASGTDYPFTLAGATGRNGTVLPTGVRAVYANGVILAPSGAGVAKLLPDGTPSSSGVQAVNFLAGVTVSNGAMVALGGGKVQATLFASGASVSAQLALDVIGYFL